MPDRGLAIGVFDLFHVGHLRYLQFAGKRCRELIVAVTPDRVALEMKGRQPIIPESQRLELVSGLGCVSEARLLPSSTEYTDSAVEWIADWKIDHVVAGGSWEDSPRWERLVSALADVGITVEFAPHTAAISTTEIIEVVLRNFGGVPACE